MKVTIKATNLDLTPEIKKAIKEKIATLDKFISHIGTSVKAFVEVALEARHHKKGKIYYAEVNIKVPGEIIRSEAREENIYKAINTVKDELQRLLRELRNKDIPIFCRMLGYQKPPRGAVFDLESIRGLKKSISGVELKVMEKENLT